MIKKISNRKYWIFFNNSFAHAFAKKKNLKISDTEGQAFVIRESGSGTRAEVERFFEKAGVTIQSSFEMTVMRPSSRLGIVSSHTVELKTGRLKEIKVKDFPIMRRWYLVQLAGKKLSPVARLFESFVLDYKEEVIDE